MKIKCIACFFVLGTLIFSQIFAQDSTKINLLSFVVESYNQTVNPLNIPKVKGAFLENKFGGTLSIKYSKSLTDRLGLGISTGFGRFTNQEEIRNNQIYRYGNYINSNELSAWYALSKLKANSISGSVGFGYYNICRRESSLSIQTENNAINGEWGYFVKIGFHRFSKPLRTTIKFSYKKIGKMNFMTSCVYIPIKKFNSSK